MLTEIVEVPRWFILIFAFSVCVNAIILAVSEWE